MHCGARLEPGAKARPTDEGWPLGRASDVTRHTAAFAAAKRYLGAGWWRDVIGVSLDGTCTRRTAERRAGSVFCDKVQSLRRVERRRARLAHKYLLQLLRYGLFRIASWPRIAFRVKDYLTQAEVTG